MRSLLKGIAGIAAATLIATPGILQATNGPLQIGYGVKSKGMGGVGIAYPQDSFAVAANPAGIVRLGCRVDAGLHWHQTEGRFHTDFEGTSKKCKWQKKDKSSETGFHHSDDNWLPEVGGIWMIGCDQALGLALYEVGHWEVEANHPFEVRLPKDWHWYANEEELGSWKREKARFARNLKSELDVFAITPSWGWQINCTHAIGISVSAVGARLRVDVTNLIDPEMSVDSNRLTNRGKDWEWGVNARIGWLGTFSDCFAVGLTYQTRTWLSHFRKYEGLIPERGNADFSSQWGIGAAWTPLCHLVIAGEAVKVFWRYGKWFENSNNNDRGLYGANNGPGLGWNDQLLLKVGAAYDVNDCLTLRIGYNYGNTPLPEGNLLNIFSMVAVQHHITLGATWMVCPGQELSIGYVHGFESDVCGPDPLDKKHGWKEDSLEGKRRSKDRVIYKFRARQNTVGVSYGVCF